MKIKCFGIARDISGLDEIHLTDRYNPTTVRQLRVHLSSLYPQLSTINSYMIAVNQEYADDDLILASTDEIAIIPPVSGG